MIKRTIKSSVWILLIMIAMWVFIVLITGALCLDLLAILIFSWTVALGITVIPLYIFR